MIVINGCIPDPRNNATESSSYGDNFEWPGIIDTGTTQVEVLRVLGLSIAAQSVDTIRLSVQIA